MMVESEDTTLIVKHLPSALPIDRQIELLTRLGAVDVKIPKSAVAVRSGLAFATFERRSHAEALLRTLHQKKLLGRYLSVEWARGRRPDDGRGVFDPGDSGGNDVTGIAAGGDSNRTGFRRAADAFRDRLTAWAPQLDFTQPPPTHLRYKYPPATTEALNNISTALKRVPRFYTQVLHLMNRMNLPCPFSDDFSLDEGPIKSKELSEAPQETSDEESELESDSESAQLKEIIPTGIKRPSGKVRPVIKRPKFGGHPLPAPSGLTLRPQEVFEQPSSTLVGSHKKIELKFDTLLDSFLEASSSNREEAKEDVQEDSNKAPLEANKPNNLTLEDLQCNRISAKDFHMLPVFKNHQAGLPTNRLYIKNLAKNVEASDLNAIYRLFVSSTNSDGDSQFEVKVMTTGRMKGQAFVTFGTTNESKQAQEQTNGYILKNKPMFVQFARSSNS